MLPISLAFLQLQVLEITSESESVRLKIFDLFAAVAFEKPSVLDGGEGNGVGRLRGSRGTPGRGRGSRRGMLMLPLGGFLPLTNAPTNFVP